MTARQLNMYKYTLEKNVAAVLAASRPDEAKAESILSDKSDKSDKLNNVENINSLSSRKPSRKGVTKRSYKELTDTEFFKNVTGDGLGNDGYIAPVDAESLVEPVLGQDNRVTNIKMNNVVMQLRKVVNHPYLLDYPLTDQGEFRIDEDLVRSCGKLMMLDRLLPALKKRGHRVLIFSQMTSMLDILQDYCYLRDIQYSRLDGSTSQEEREAEIKAFRNDENRSVFLLSTRAGGLGINLVSADTVIIYDSDWNPQVDLQAMDRAHRIGQTKPVLVYRLVTNATIEERVFDKAQTKRRLEKLVVHKDKFKGVIANGEATKGALTMDDILRVLNEKDRVQVCDDPLGVVSDADLEKWLDRSEAAFIPPIDQSDNHKVIGIESATTKFLAE
ncbi:hypothetical protein SARC_11486 [Sphaeroforma arctica JP610]|uniref:Helicase C-terminal domain-containing protein n=1 Tax=Sphaeroforma arctica JP610 TaxID=667725 RepID=A0A0L0FHQ6_9EUKA|nr:hypothetical protein SARC_11486 [Sphaeroforma arctica JP610]KNC76001.1 hypothetical protein SARC_11486 [Sphaeroforma arctica JP610]|eukprot:XP_014149903.1 hypothetical protein SARC_11486 [Sphaeroforma arctica JP610]